jgi:LysR family glycine cleavage system transcriptional activator
MERLNRYPLGGVRAVEVVGRLGGLAGAAAELGVTVGAVSQHIRKVEAQLGRAVFERTSKGLRPTAAGAPLLDGLTRGFREISRAIAAAEERPGSILTVSVAPVLAAKWLVPRLNRFYLAHPGVGLRIDASSRLVDFEDSDIDVGVRVGSGPWSHVHAEKLAALELFPVCSPPLAKRIRAIDDLSGLPILRDHGSPGRWLLWLAARDAAGLLLGAGPIYSDAGLCLDAAIAGQGIAMAWPTLATDALRSGVLCAPFPDRVASGEFYWLVRSPVRAPSLEVRAFARWLRSELEADLVV